MAPRSTEDKLYEAIQGAEHQGFLEKEGYSPWIRTKAKGTGSSAFGPVQLTGGGGSMLANVARGGADIGTTSEEMDWIKSSYLPRAGKALKFGGSDMPVGGIDPLTGEDVSKYDYGGDWGFTGEDKMMYENISKKLIGSEFKRAGGNMGKFIQSWRGKSREQDPDYYEFIEGQISIGDQKKSIDPSGVAMEAMSKIDKPLGY